MEDIIFYIVVKRHLSSGEYFTAKVGTHSNISHLIYAIVIYAIRLYMIFRINSSCIFFIGNAQMFKKKIKT